MDIANPIYDVVFRYLMNDNRVAKLIISTITGMEIETLEFRATEKISLLEKQALTIYRLDFAASIITKEGKRKKVLIEIQKAKYPQDIMRFRRYLGQEYRDKNNCVKEETSKGTAVKAIPILTIYFLGYSLQHTKAPVIMVNRSYTNAVTGETITEPEDFIESLTHDSYVVQIPYLKHKRQNDLLTVLSIFDQGMQTADGEGHILRIQENDFPEKYHEIIRRLQKAVAEPEVRETMDLEDEIIEDLQDKERMILKERIAKEQAQAEKEEERIAKEQAQAEKEEERIAKEQAQAEQVKERVAKEQALKELEALRKLMGDSTAK
ncbi:MAG: hypothetical protein COB67_03800 [SAR324 cluster bacterium]|uniref:PD-(D/E)XK nuclease family transposase n=1 Tax=SAR324 cluster bacterium TaxID=2024889 RepID=A0A2A4T8I4_9DELT|nr:MAG: hypothetical protein COB67_03800 [SAR324 cluster bacterium]